MEDIIACGFDPAKTFLFRDTDYIKELYPVTLQIQKRVSMRCPRPGCWGA